MLTFLYSNHIFRITAIFAVMFMLTKDVAAQNRRGTEYTPRPLPFEVNEKELTDVLQRLEKALSCKAAFDQVGNLVITQDELEDFINQTQDSDIPIRPEAITVYLTFTEALKNELKTYYGHIKSIKLIKQVPRYGQSSKMKVVGLYLHLIMADDTPLPLRLQILEYNGHYELFTLDS